MGQTLGLCFVLGKFSGNKKQREWIGYQDKNIHHLPFPYPWKTSEKDAEKFLEKSLKSLKKKINFPVDKLFYLDKNVMNHFKLLKIEKLKILKLIL